MYLVDESSRRTFVTSEIKPFEFITTANVSRHVRILSWNMIDFYIQRNMKNVMFNYMPVVMSDNI